jgi:hypothetical protein
MAGSKGGFEEHCVTGDQLISKLKQILHEGNVRRIVIKDENDKVLIEIPLALGVVGVLLAPVWAAVGGIAALASNLKIVVVREQGA